MRESELLNLAGEFIGKGSDVKAELLERIPSEEDQYRIVRYKNTRGSFIIAIKSIFKVQGRILNFYEPI